MKKFVILLALILLQFFFQSPVFAIKIGIIDSADRVIVGTSTKGLFVNPADNRKIYDTVGMKAYELKAHKSTIGIKISGKYYDLGSNYVVLRPEYETGYVSAKN